MSVVNQPLSARKSIAPFQLVGHSPRIREVARLIERVAPGEIPVLISGESGTGKEVVARLIHLHSTRRLKPFLKVACSSVPHDLLESELFGFERGSFTGAYTLSKGKFELAEGGSLFLDEIGELELGIQPKLLHALQDQRFFRLGARQESVVDVRFIFSTQRPLELLVAEGKFRQDLFHRMNVIKIHLPPLRERKEDIPDLVEYFLHKYSELSHLEVIPLTDLQNDHFLQYDWPGNIRELENAIRQLVAMGGESMPLESFPMNMEEQVSPAHQLNPEAGVVLSLKKVARAAAKKAEREMILLALKKTNWNRKRAAELLQVSYKAMLYKLKEAGFSKRVGTT